jgi:hypothetical protein
MRKFLLVCSLAASVHVTYAQTTLSAPAPAWKAKTESTLQVHLGTQGVGVAYRRALTPTTGLRLGVSGVPRLSYSDSAAKYQNDIAGQMANAHLLADFRLFKKGLLKDVRLVAGAAYVSLKGTYIRTPHDGSFRYGDIALTKEETGSVTVDVRSKGLAAYAGVTAFDFFKRKNVRMNADFGTYFLPRPQTTLTGTGMMAGMDKQNAQLEENIKSYRWLPVLQLNLLYNL